MSDLRDVVVPIYERRGPIWKGLGTASIIGSFGSCAIFLTARHVLEGLVDEMQQQRPVYPRLSGAAAIVGSLGDMHITEVHQIQISNFSDIAFGVLLAPEGKSFDHRIAVDPSPVFPGTEIRAIGYCGLPLTHQIDWDKEHFSARMEFRVEAREGRTLDRRPNGVRMLKWPVFSVDTPFDSAMSGGPIVEMRGAELVLRGVICSDMTVDNDLGKGGGFEAWASEIWPILMTPYRFSPNFIEEDGSPIEVQTIFDLFRQGFIQDRGNTARDFVWVPQGKTVCCGWRGAPEVHVAPLA